MMTVEVDSEKRSQRIQKEIKKRLGEEATLLHIDATPVEGTMKEFMKNPAKGGPGAVPGEEKLIRESPEMAAYLAKLREEHWRTWPDIPVPALNGMTPRKAAKSARGRELLESLLLEYEARSERATEEFNRVDVGELRKQLGLRNLSP
jgi:hypothetical protein